MKRWLMILFLLLAGCTQGATAPSASPTPPPATATPDPDWVTYTEENGRFAIDLHSSVPLQTSRQTGVIDGVEFPITVIQASYLDSDRQAITYYRHPRLASGSLSAAAYLETFDLSGFGSAAQLENVRETAVQLGPHPGKEWSFQLTDQTVRQLHMRVRVYVVDDTIYQLTAGSLISVTDDTAERFFNSFTVTP